MYTPQDSGDSSRISPTTIPVAAFPRPIASPFTLRVPSGHRRLPDPERFPDLSPGRQFTPQELARLQRLRSSASSEQVFSQQYQFQPFQPPRARSHTGESRQGGNSEVRRATQTRGRSLSHSNAASNDATQQPDLAHNRARSDSYRSRTMGPHQAQQDYGDRILRDFSRMGMC
jgi:hypothetical protein